MYPHRIRLRGPWECAETNSARPPRRVTVPCRLRDAAPAGCEVTLTRKFGYPGQIDSFERVWLTFADVRGNAAISLNGSLLTPQVWAGPCEFNVSPLLRPHNRLEIVLSAGPDGDGLIGETALEIRCAVVLSKLRADRSGTQTVVTGELAGSWPEPFDLYFFVDDVQVDYQNVRTDGERTTIRAFLNQDGVVRVDLIQGATLWSSVRALPSD